MKTSPALGGAARRAAARFWPDKHLYFYGMAKAASDPAYRHVAGAIGRSKFPLLDIGCGAGILAAYLRACGYEGPIVGLDADPEKIAKARCAMEGCRADFTVGDALALPPHAGHVTALDVMHYFDPASQARLLAEIRARLVPGTCAWIRLTLRDSSWRFALTRAEEWFVATTRWIPFRGRHFPSREEIRDLCPDATLVPMWGGTPFNSYMLQISCPAER